jgi:hypothetical protein
MDVGWSLFNHRLSTLEIRPVDEGVAFTFVGGVSTTAVSFYDETCPEGGSSTCDELPTLDEGNLEATLSEATSSDVVFGDAAARLLVVGAEPVSDTVRVVLARPVDADASVTAWIAGFGVWSGVPLPEGAASCYDPRHGWLPTELSLAVTDAVVADGGQAVDVTVEASFDAGLTLEDIRACLDAVADLAALRVDLDLVVAAGGEPRSAEVSNAASWPLDRTGTQPPPTSGADADDVGALGDASGWRAMRWRFHTDDPDGRGAYLRSIGLRLDPSAGDAAGWATNQSATMLSGFDYAFTGEVVGVAGEVSVTTRAISARDVPAAVSPEGEGLGVIVP